MQRSSRVSEAVIRRLPKYYRYLKDMEKSGIQSFIQGTEQRMGLTAPKSARISIAGGFGLQGMGTM